MQELLTDLLPIFLFFALGLLLRTTRFAGQEHAAFLLKLVFFVTLPALIFLSVSQATISAAKLWLPAISIAINVANMAIAMGICRAMGVAPRTAGALIVSAMTTNSVFVFPFILTGLGPEAFTDAVLFDFGNALTVGSITYALAFRYGEERDQPISSTIFRIGRSPVVWALVLAVLFSVFAIPVPAVIAATLGPVGQMTSPLILIGLGILISTKLSDARLVVIPVFIRMVLGLSVGALLAALLGLQGTTRVTVILLSAAPIGFTAVTFSSLAKLNTEFTASAVSASIIVGILYIPTLMYLLK